MNYELVLFLSILSFNVGDNICIYIRTMMLFYKSYGSLDKGGVIFS